MIIKKAYFYIFYKFYKFGEWSPSIFPSDWTATLAIGVLEILFLASMKFYYIEYVDPNNELTLTQVVLSIFIVFTINTIAFLINEKWKCYVKEFDKLPKYKNIIGTWVVVTIVTFVLVNVIVSFSIMGQIAAHRH